MEESVSMTSFKFKTALNDPGACYLQVWLNMLSIQNLIIILDIDYSVLLSPY